MAKRALTNPSWTPAVLADGLLTNGNFMAIGAGSTTQLVNVMEFYLGGQAGASNVALMVWARSSTLGATPTAVALPVSDGPLTGSASALSTPATAYTAATTAPTRSPAATVARLNFSFNTFGGIVRWVAAPGEEWQIIGTATSLSETTLSNFTGGSASAQMGTHIVYEPF